MTVDLALAAPIVAVVAALRSTWSPCGLSMLATITPLAEQGRGHRYRVTATWFVAGSVLGGTMLGGAMALLALAVGLLPATDTELAVVAVLAGAITVAADTRVASFLLPVHFRQVNERWLDQFRPWVYGAGFGWQIGTGLATYIKTCAVYLMIVLAVLTGSPTSAVAIGAIFGLVRGLAVFFGHRITTPAALADFHRRFMAVDRFALVVVVVCEVAVTVGFATVVSVWLAATMALVFAATLGVPRRIKALRRTSSGPATGATAPSMTIR